VNTHIEAGAKILSIVRLRDMAQTPCSEIIAGLADCGAHRGPRDIKAGWIALCPQSLECPTFTSRPLKQFDQDHLPSYHHNPRPARQQHNEPPSYCRSIGADPRRLSLLAHPLLEPKQT
jgi:hypothetical protein